VASLVIVVSAVLVYRVDKQTDRDRDTQTDADERFTLDSVSNSSYRKSEHANKIPRIKVILKKKN